jgi:hypothetical protein
MVIHGSHDGIRYRIEEVGNGAWRWSFHPSGGRPRSGRVVGDRLWAAAEACRAIEIWHQSAAQAA